VHEYIVDRFYIVVSPEIRNFPCYTTSHFTRFSQLPLRLNLEVGAPGVGIFKPPTDNSVGFAVNATATTLRYSAALLADPVPLVESLLQAFVDELSLRGPIGKGSFILLWT
jgi:hypothetical protein